MKRPRNGNMGVDVSNDDAVGSDQSNLPTPPQGTAAVAGAWPLPPPPAAAPVYPGQGYPPGLVQPAAPAIGAPVAPPAPAYYPAASAGVPMPGAPSPERKRQSGSSADNAGFKIIAWVGAGVTLVGVVLLLAIAVQNDWLNPLTRVVIGHVLGLLLIGAAFALRRDERRAVLGTVLACTGLAVEFLTVVGSVRPTHIVPPVVGYVESAAIVAVAVWMSVLWAERWLAGTALLLSALLAPAVGGGLPQSVLIFEVIVVAGGAACLFGRLGLWSWIGASGGAMFVMLFAIADVGYSAEEFYAVVAAVAIAWITMLARQVQGQAPVDPGPFPIRVPSADPVQVAKDYADFYAHQQLRAQARTDVGWSAATLIGSALLLVLAVGQFDPSDHGSTASAVVAGGMAVIFGIVAWLGSRPSLFGALSAMVTVTAFGTALALAALMILRLVEGDVQGLLWLALAILALACVGAARQAVLLWPAIGIGTIVLLTSGHTVHLDELLSWPASSLVSPNGVYDTTWTRVFPAGLLIILLSVAVVWSVGRCLGAIDPTGPTAGWATRENRPTGEHRAWMSASDRDLIVTWTTMIGIAIACYGLLVSVMVVAYAIAPSKTGYQAGQVAVTAIITIAGVVLLWQGFRRLVLRVAGLVVLGCAVAKLMLFDTQSLSAALRAVTFIGVGVLLLLAAFMYLKTMARMQARDEAATDGQGPGSLR